MSNTAEIGSGATVGVEPTAGAGSYTLLGEVVSITPPGTSIDSVDVTHMGSGEVREFIPGLADPGEIEITYHFVPGNGTDDLVETWIAAREIREMRLTYGNAETLTFDAFPTGISYDIPLDDKQTATLTCKVTGAKTRS